MHGKIMDEMLNKGLLKLNIGSQNKFAILEKKVYNA